MSVSLLTSILNKNRLDAALKSIENGIKFTQMAAIAYGKPAIFCGSQNHMTCDGHWNDGQLTILAQYKTLRQYPPLPTNYQLLWRSSLGKNNQLTFTPRGTAEQSGSFYLCQKNSNACQIRIILLQTGRIRIARQS